MIKTSVIIPIYNTEKYLHDCIDSVLKQTQKEIEIILVDDGSTDNSGQIVDEYASQYENIVAVHQENHKQGAARNKGLSIAKGEYVYFLDSDDCIEKTTLEECYECAKAKQADFIMFDMLPCSGNEEGLNEEEYVICDRTEKTIDTSVFSGKKYWSTYRKRGGVFTSAPLTYICRKFIQQNNIYFYPDKVYEDIEWTVLMFLKADRVAYLPKRFYYRRWRKNSTMSSRYSAIHFTSAFKTMNILLNIDGKLVDLEDKLICEDVLMGSVGRISKVWKNLVVSEKRVCMPYVFERMNELLDNSSSMSLQMMLCIFILIKNLGMDKKNNDYHVEINQDKVCELSKRIHQAIREGYQLEKKICIGIYGMGELSDAIFDWYRKNEISINADICFIVTEAKQEYYREFPVYDIHMAQGLKLDHIIIASVKYADEMMDNIRKNHIYAENCFVTVRGLKELLSM